MARHWRSWLAGGAAVALLAACGPAGPTAAVSTSTSTAAPAPTTAHTVAASPTSTRAPAPARPTPAPTPTLAPTAKPTVQTTAGTAAKAAVRVYFTQGGKLVAETRSVAPTNVLRESIAALLAGPDEAGHYSQAPAGTRLLGVNLAAGTATLNLSEQVEQLQGSPAIPLFLAQVVNTATQFPTVQRVRLQVNGHPLRSLGGEGFAVPDPLDQAAVQRLLDAA